MINVVGSMCGLLLDWKEASTKDFVAIAIGMDQELNH